MLFMNFNTKLMNRCFEAGTVHCAANHIYPKPNQNKYKTVQDNNFSTDVLFRPQRVQLKLHVGEEYPLKLRYRHTQDYPVDLYYLMDLSASMEDDKDSLSKLGSKLAAEMQALTRDFRLGFGSFVDKVEMPYVSTVPEKLEHPCDLKSGQPCAAPYGFKNHLKLDTNTSLFSMKVNEAKVSGNLDYPEGGFDAVMQAIVCQKQIGWRQKARHLLVFSSDSDFHFAGDGRLAGLVEPNDMQCYVTDDGNYTHSLVFDYPSISQINQVARQNNINIIFAITESISKIYKHLVGSIEGSSYGILSGDSSNVVKLVRDEYQKIVDSIGLISTGNKQFVDVHFNSSCISGDWKETSTCDGLRPGSEVEFIATIKVLQCPENKNSVTFNIKPRALEDSITVELEIDCDCACEQPGSEGYERNSRSCSWHGNFQCGVCNCDGDWYGDQCQCERNSVTPVHLNENACRMNNNSELCSGFGVCECGVCTCNVRPNANERYYGKFCECDNFTCRRHGGLPCSGPDHGICECGTCVCQWGWSGEACECPDSKENCYPSDSSEECMGRGSCKCGICKCKENYSGKYCDECPSCPGQRCEKYESLVACKVFGTGPLSKEECDMDMSITTVEVDYIDPEEVKNNTQLRVCSFPDDQGCTFLFRYLIDNSTVEVQRTKQCGSDVNVLALVLGVIGGIVFIGLLLLLVWKIVTSIHDHREYVKFEKERSMSKWDRGDNPLYKQATSTFNNPMFGGE
ncbi:integrin beta-PS-like isoform X2 [Zootermopsis nevadensis]|uniref:Integrin beta n=1 Tax=Zootermopsis nevadensis TaxID=136037 RepID=A0A067QK14_ZOONE|nr:integrin beta-PS-like isoform X2 [Zootermopsis nevadensis]XP_021939843.1 integrin beta-PS-like isoform X2 [Zootermopsis nevadensis]XP_021939844.1 integrin beta-PS-like isoform X2 [Zootermopsis nevadensis]XP_021939845.1 integrin beta-PS-like isoform X2 [Zootermopsis nevadensis]XP_021939846.1 integrin beta-PS-like isoform X2 [Zootermopsis nevadensis]XP_021939847.1 integrin beta-PS-like isoform X2 [Zootermopsis nevadensis]XP_021939849.1 integrin beta-PS-like isoform X2 [Zootermopsis nevadensi